MSLPDIDEVMERAILSYRIVKKLRIMNRSPANDYTTKNLAEDYPEYYILGSEGGNIRFIGETAGEILEDYLTNLEYPSGSDIWFRLARIVIKIAEAEENEVI